MLLVVLLGLATAVVAIPTDYLREVQAQSSAQASSSAQSQGQLVANDAVNNIPIYKPGFNTYGFNVFSNMYDKNFLNYYYNFMKEQRAPYQEKHFKDIFPYVYYNYLAKQMQQPEYEPYQYDYLNMADDSFRRVNPYFNQEVQQDFDRFFWNYEDFQSAMYFYKYVFPYLNKHRHNHEVQDIDRYSHNYAGPYSNDFYQQMFPYIYNKNYPYYEMNDFDHSYDHMGPYSSEYYHKFIFPFINKIYRYHNHEVKSDYMKPYWPEYFYQYMNKNHQQYNREVQDVDRHEYPYSSDYFYKYMYPYMNKKYQQYNYDVFDKDYYNYRPYSSEFFYKFMQPYMSMYYPYNRYDTKNFPYNSHKQYLPEYFYKYFHNMRTHYPKYDFDFENFHNYIRGKREID